MTKLKLLLIPATFTSLLFLSGCAMSSYPPGYSSYSSTTVYSGYEPNWRYQRAERNWRWRKHHRHSKKLRPVRPRKVPVAKRPSGLYGGMLSSKRRNYATIAKSKSNRHNKGSGTKPNRPRQNKPGKRR